MIHQEVQGWTLGPGACIDVANTIEYRVFRVMRMSTSYCSEAIFPGMQHSVSHEILTEFVKYLEFPSEPGKVYFFSPQPRPPSGNEIDHADGSSVGTPVLIETMAVGY